MDAFGRDPDRRQILRQAMVIDGKIDEFANPLW
jgi:hypothetical protein